MEFFAFLIPLFLGVWVCYSLSNAVRDRLVRAGNRYATFWAISTFIVLAMPVLILVLSMILVAYQWGFK